MGEHGDKEEVQLTNKEKLVDEVKAKLSELLRQDGREITLADLGPSLYVEYLLDPKPIGDIETPQNKDADARLIINQKRDKSGLFGRLLAIERILEDDLETSSYTFIFNEGVTPSFQYRGHPGDLDSNKKFFSRKVKKEELADFLEVLNQPLYLIDSPR